MRNNNFTPEEMIVIAGSRVLEDKKVVFAGTGLPIIAITLAQLTHAPNLVPVFEAGAVGPTLNKGLPLSVGDSRTTISASFLQGLNTTFEFAQRGFCDIGFIGGAEIDPYGNVNSTMIGQFPEEYGKPQVRLPGSGGAHDMACSTERTIIIMKHESRRFKEKLSYLTSPGYIDGTLGARRKAGLLGKGPFKVITTKAILGFDEKTFKMKLLATLPGETVESVVKNTGFELIIPDLVEEFKPPTPKELYLIREVIDPERYYI